jgi:hypothetical protein
MVVGMNLFRGKAANIIRVLLVNYPRTWTTRNLSTESGVALGWTSEVCTTLVRERFAIRESERGEIKLMEPIVLLKRWANYNNFTATNRFIDYYTREEDVSKLYNKFKSVNGPKYAFTGLAGALLVAPFVRPTNVHIYVKSDNDADQLAKNLDLMLVEENGNVKFVIAANGGVFYSSRQIDGLQVVSDVQLYVDLLNYPGRGEEAAGELLKIIEEKWRSED